MSNSNEVNASSGEMAKQTAGADTDVTPKTCKSNEPSIKDANYEKETEKVTVPDVEQPEKTAPSAGREASYVYDVLNMPSTVDTAGLRPDPGFEVKQSTFGQGLQEASKSADELLIRKDSSDIYKEELVKLAQAIQPSGSPLSTLTKSEYGPEYRLVEDPQMAKIYHFPRQWIAPVSGQVLEQNKRAISERKDGAVRIVDETVLTGHDFAFYRERRLFANKRNAFFLGKYKRQVVLVKKINPSTASGQASASEPIWVAIAKRISYTQQLEEDKAEQMKGSADTSGETTGLSSMATNDTVISSSIGSKPPENAHYRAIRPFLQVYEIFCLESDRSWLVFLEMAHNKTMHYRVKQRALTDAAQARLWSAQILDGITFLANHAVAHRAIRLEHLVLDSEQNVRLIGWRRAILCGIVTRRERRIRANNHLPPEAFRGGYEAGSIDLWSWGVVLVSLTTFRYPFNVRHQRGTVEEEWSSFKSRHQASCHPQVVAVLDDLFQSEPEKRATVGHIQQSVWFGGPGNKQTIQVISKEASPAPKSFNEKSISRCKSTQMRL